MGPHKGGLRTSSTVYTATRYATNSADTVCRPMIHPRDEIALYVWMEHTPYKQEGTH